MKNATEKIKYPQYRKYHNNRSYFKIISSEEFEEIQFVGAKPQKHGFVARILPDRNFIYDLTFEYEKYGTLISEQEYYEVEKQLFRIF